MNVYSELGVKRVINAIGAWTRIGGSTLPPEVIEAFVDANSCYVELSELEKKGGDLIAELTGAEAGYITSGAFSALVLSTAACMTGTDPEKIKKLPDTKGMRNQVVHQKCLRYKYDRAVTVPGAKMVLVGDKNRCSPKQIEASLSMRTAAILYLAPGQSAAVSIDDAVEIGKEHGIPTIIDVPGNIYGSEMWVPGSIYPDEGYKNYVKLGVDLVCCGGKYVGAPQSTGYVIGRKDLIEAVALNSFVGYENPSDLYRGLGRGYKLDRQSIVGLVFALKRWKTLDHRSRLQNAHRKKRYLIENLARVPNVKINEVPDSSILVGFEVTLEERNGDETYSVVQKLLEGDPRIEVWYSRGGMVRGWVRSSPNSFVVNVMYLEDRDEEILARRLKATLSI